MSATTEAEMRAAEIHGGTGLSKRKRPILPERDPYPDPVPLYPDVIAAGSLSAAVRAAAVEHGFAIPPKAFKSIAKDRYHPLFGLTVHSRIRRREGLRVTGSRHSRVWWVEGGQASHRIQGHARELVDVARVALAWHNGVALAEIAQAAPFVTLQAVDYRYLGVVREHDEPGEPSTVLRLWTDAAGNDREETFHRSLTWEVTDDMSPLNREPYEPEPVEVDLAAVERFIHRITENVKAERRRT